MTDRPDPTRRIDEREITEPPPPGPPSRYELAEAAAERLHELYHSTAPHEAPERARRVVRDWWRHADPTERIAATVTVAYVATTAALFVAAAR